MEKRHNTESWWNRPCGGFEVLRQAVPLIISSGSISLMNFTDRMFLMWWNPDAMTASMQGGMLFWSAVSVPSAIAMFVTTFVAQYVGSGNPQRVGSAVWQGIWLGLLAMPILFLVMPFLSGLFDFFGHSQTLLELEKEYFWILLWGSGATIAGEAAAAFFRGRGKMHIEMNVNVFCVILNVVLDYWMIFGKVGFPAMGLAGAAYATMISQWVRFFLYIVLMFLDDRKEKKYNIFQGMKPDFPLVGRLLYYGVPSSFYSFVDIFTFTLFIMIIGGIGTLEAEATTIAFTMNSLSFLPLAGIGVAVISMVGNQLGDNRPDLARRATNTALAIGCIATGFCGFLYLVIPHILLNSFAAFAELEHFEETYGLTIVLLRFIALYLFFDMCSIIFSSALRGAGDTMFVMRVVFAIAPFLPLLSYTGVKYFGLGLYWCWTMLVLNVLFYYICFTWRFCGKHWEKFRVIEKELQKG